MLFLFFSWELKTFPLPNWTFAVRRQHMDGALSKEMLSFEFRSSFRFITSSVVCLFLKSLIAFVNLGPDLVNPVQLASCTWIKDEV